MESTDELVDIVYRQTDYSKEEALKKLEEFNMDVNKVIQSFLHSDKPIKESNTGSLNQTVFKHYRTQLGNNMREYEEHKRKQAQEEALKLKLKIDEDNNKIKSYLDTKNTATNNKGMSASQYKKMKKQQAKLNDSLEDSALES